MVSINERPAVMPDVIRASIHESAIKRVSKFFTASAVETLNELFQNSRRANAGIITVTAHEDQTITVADDGDGVLSPRALLEFGNSEWSEQTANSEDPAGMGFFSLARAGSVTIRSKPRVGGNMAWQVELEQDHFLGCREAQVQQLDPADCQYGTAITFSLPGFESDNVHQAALYLPIPVFFNGERVEQKDFLEGAISVVEWEGVRIGVFSGGRQSRNPGRQPWQISYTENSHQINFHGVTATGANLPSVWSLDTRSWGTLVDIKDCNRLELALPARRAVIECDFLNRLRQRCLREIFLTVAAQDTPVPLAYNHYRSAAEAGVELEQARPKIGIWQPKGYEEPQTEFVPWETIQNPIIVSDINMPRPDQHSLMRAARNAGIHHRLVCPNIHLVGYDWYDSLDQLRDYAITVEKDGQAVYTRGPHMHDDPPSIPEPDRIVITLMIAESGGTTIPMQLETDLIFSDPFQNFSEHPTPLMVKGAPMSVYMLRDILMKSFFSYDEEYDSDSLDTQEYKAEDTCLEQATRILESDEAALVASISNATNHFIQHHVPAQHRVVIILEPLAEPVVTVEPL